MSDRRDEKRARVPSAGAPSPLLPVLRTRAPQITGSGFPVARQRAPKDAGPEIEFDPLSEESDEVDVEIELEFDADHLLAGDTNVSPLPEWTDEDWNIGVTVPRGPVLEAEEVAGAVVTPRQQNTPAPLPSLVTNPDFQLPPELMPVPAEPTTVDESTAPAPPAADEPPTALHVAEPSPATDVAAAGGRPADEPPTASDVAEPSPAPDVGATGGRPADEPPSGEPDVLEEPPAPEASPSLEQPPSLQEPARMDTPAPAPDVTPPAPAATGNARPANALPPSDIAPGLTARQQRTWVEALEQRGGLLGNAARLVGTARRLTRKGR